jgi:hypothetical protein
MIVALSDRFLLFNHVRQVVIHAPPPRCEVSVIFMDTTSKRFSGADAERIVDYLASLCLPKRCPDARQEWESLPTD